MGLKIGSQSNLKGYYALLHPSRYHVEQAASEAVGVLGIVNVSSVPAGHQLRSRNDLSNYSADNSGWQGQSLSDVLQPCADQFILQEALHVRA